VCDSGNHNTQEPSQVFLRVEIWDEGGTGYYGVPAESKSKGFQVNRKVYRGKSQ
jgi:hypothetical protein